MGLRDYFDQIRHSSSGTLVALGAVVVVWILVLGVIIAGIVFYFERPNLAQPGTPTAQAITLDPTAGPAGTPVTITGQGWPANNLISIYLLAPGQTQIPNFATAQATVDAQGLFTTTAAIPTDSAWLAPGTAQVIAEVAGGGPAARAPFVVLPATSGTQTPTGTITSTVTGTPSLTSTPVPAPTGTGTPTPAPTATPGPATATANTAVNVRTGPGTNYPVIGTLLAGQSAGITGVSPDGAWWQINFAGGAGWVSSFFVIAQNTQNVPVVTPPPLPPTPTAVPQAPLAVIGIFNQGPTGQIITFDGSGSRASAGHNLVAFAWDFGDGTTANGVTVTHSYGQPGNYVVTLTVTDDQGLTSEATQTVQFQRLPPIPIIGAPNRGSVGDSITFDGSQSIANSGIIVSYEWDFGDGTQASGITADHTYDRPGNYRVVLTTVNSAGLSASADHDIRIEGQPTAIIDAPSQGQVGQPITFRGRISFNASSASSIARFAWNFGDGTSADGQTVSHVYAQPGSFVVSLTVTDRRGQSDTATQAIAISQAFQAPTAVIRATSQGTSGQPITFDGSGSTPGSGQIVNYAWNFGDGTNSSGPVVTHVYAQPGTYTIVLNVTNSNNLTATATEVIAVGQAAQPPKAVIKTTGQGTAGQPVSFDGSGSTPGSGQIVSYAWDFGDGTTGSGATVSHVYASAGNYTITLRVTNSSNQTDTATQAFAIGQAAQPPTAAINAPAQGTEGQPVSFDGSGSTPGSGQIVRYDWTFGDGATGGGATVSHVYVNAGNYTVTLKVTNNSNQTATATRAIAIGQATKPPKAVINAPNEGQVGRAVTFDGSGSTAGGQITSYTWDFGDGTTGNGARVDHTYANAGTYTVGLTVTSSTGQTASATHGIRIEGSQQPVAPAPGGGVQPPVQPTQPPAQPTQSPPAQPPRAVISAPDAGEVRQPVTFEGGGSTPGSGQIVRYDWSFGDGTTGSGAAVSHVYARAGDYTVTLRVTDSGNQAASASHAIAISPVVTQPQPQPPLPGGGGNQPGGVTPTPPPPGGGNPPAGGTQPPGRTPPFGGGSPFFGGGQGGLRAVISAAPAGRANQPITFDGSRSTAGGGQIAGYAWNFGDGTAGSGATVSHAYARAGLYVVTLTVTDSRGQSATASTGVIIP